MVNIITADGLVTQEATTSAAMLLTGVSWGAFQKHLWALKSKSS